MILNPLKMNNMDQHFAGQDENPFKAPLGMPEPKTASLISPEVRKEILALKCTVIGGIIGGTIGAVSSVQTYLPDIQNISQDWEYALAGVLRTGFSALALAIPGFIADITYNKIKRVMQTQKNTQE